MAKKGLVKTYIIFCLFFLTSDKSWADRVLINDTIIVKPERYMYYKLLSPQQRVKWSFEITVLSGGNRDIDIWLLDSENFVKFSNGQSFLVYPPGNRRRATELVSEFFPKSNKAYYLVLDNSFSWITSKKVSVYLIELETLGRVSTTTSTTTTTIPLTSTTTSTIPQVTTTTTIPSTSGTPGETWDAFSLYLETYKIFNEMIQAIDWIDNNYVGDLMDPSKMNIEITFTDLTSNDDDCGPACSKGDIFAGRRGGVVYVNYYHLEDMGKKLGSMADDALAGIIGHEIGHIFYGHKEHKLELTSEQVLMLMGLTAINPALGILGLWALNQEVQYYDRIEELDADAFGVVFASLIGYNPNGLVKWLEMVENPLDFIYVIIGLSDHPTNQERIRTLAPIIAESWQWFGAWQTIKNQVGSSK